MLLSIIMPVCNVAPYIEKCLASLLCQGLAPSDYELIVVNDGSTDESYTIAKTFLEHQASLAPFTFHLISQPNGGLSAARNMGIRHAKGKYIQFVDSDDYLEPHVLGALVQKMEQEQLDVLRFNYQNVNEEYQVYEPYKDHKPFVVLAVHAGRLQQFPACFEILQNSEQQLRAYSSYKQKQVYDFL